MEHSTIASNKVKKIKSSEFYGNYDELDEAIPKKKIKFTDGIDDRKCQHINVDCNSLCENNYFIQSQNTTGKNHQSESQIFIANEGFRLGQEKIDRYSGKFLNK
jgi:hypothetical protein